MIKKPMYAKGELGLVLRKDLGTWLREHREKRGLTMADIAQALGWKYYNYVNSVESGRMALASEHYVAYANVLEIDPKEFTKRCLRSYDPVTWDILFGSGKGVIHLPRK